MPLQNAPLQTESPPCLNRPLYLETLAITIQRCTRSEVVSLILKSLSSSLPPCRLYFVNLHALVVLSRSQDVKRAYQEAEIVVNDGIGMDIGLQLLREPSFRENCNGTDLVPEILTALPSSARLFVLGATPAFVRRMAAIVEKDFPLIQLVGFRDGYFEGEAEGEAAVLEQMKIARPNVLLVGMGVPKQELFLHKNWEELTRAGVKVAIAGGAVIDFMSGSIKRAPPWMRRAHLEWLYRFIHEPKRLFKRYFVEPFLFLYLIWAERHARS